MISQSQNQPRNIIFQSFVKELFYVEARRFADLTLASIPLTRIVCANLNNSPRPTANGPKPSAWTRTWTRARRDPTSTRRPARRPAVGRTGTTETEVTPLFQSHQGRDRLIRLTRACLLSTSSSGVRFPSRVTGTQKVLTLMDENDRKESQLCVRVTRPHKQSRTDADGGC